MKNSGLISLCMLVWVLNACGSSDSRDSSIVAEYVYDTVGTKVTLNVYRAGQKISLQEFQLLDDSLVPHGAHRDWFLNGRLEREYTFISGLKEGSFQEYDSLGNIRFRFWFRNDGLDSIGLMYFDNGKLAQRNYYLDGRLFGQREFFSPAGHLTEVFLHAKKRGYVFHIKYDSSGNYFEKRGSPMMVIYNYDSLPINRDYIVAVHLADLPGMNPELYWSIIDRRGDTVQSETVKAFNQMYGCFYDIILHRFKKKGKYQVVFYVTYEDVSKETKLLQDSGRVNLVVE